MHNPCMTRKTDRPTLNQPKPGQRTVRYAPGGPNHQCPICLNDPSRQGFSPRQMLRTDTNRTAFMQVSPAMHVRFVSVEAGYGRIV